MSDIIKKLKRGDEGYSDRCRFPDEQVKCPQYDGLGNSRYSDEKYRCRNCCDGVCFWPVNIKSMQNMWKEIKVRAKKIKNKKVDKGE